MKNYYLFDIIGKIGQNWVPNEAWAHPFDNIFGIARKNGSKTHSQTGGPEARFEVLFRPFQPFGTKIRKMTDFCYK